MKGIKMKILILLLLAFPNILSAASRFSGGKIEIATVTVNGVEVFNKFEFQKEVDKYDLSSGSFPLVIQAISVDPDEINISTICVTFENYTDFQSCKTKAGLEKKIREIRAQLDSMSDLPALRTRDLRERVGWIKSYYQGLP